MAKPPPKPILFVHHRSELGGAPTSLSYLIRHLDREAFEPHVYCPDGPAAELFREAGATVWTGPVATFTHIWASVYRGRRWLLFGRELVWLVPHLVRLNRVLRSHSFEVVHLNDAPLLPAALLVRRRAVPIVWHLRSALPPDGNDGRSRLIRRVIRHLADVSIAINEDVAASYALGTTAIPNSVELDRFRPGGTEAAKEALGLDPAEPVVTFFGFLYPSKGFADFISAAAELRDRGFRAQYLMVGGAVRSEEFFHTLIGRGVRFLDLARNYEAEARRLVSEHGLDEAIRFVPFTRDTASLYRASDIVVAPSRGPELGRPVIEAAASGVPVVATGSSSGGGVVVPGRTGLLVDDADVHSLAEAIGSLLSSPERRRAFGEAARAHAEDHFDPATNARRVEEIYGSVVRTRDGVPVLYVHHRPQLGGAPSSLATLIESLDPRFEPHVYCPPGPAAELFAHAGARVHTGPVSIFAHSWDRPYKGLLWLLVGREALTLPGHLVRLNALIARHRFPIVHLNDSPLLPAAWVARRRRARVVWHLRSALAGEGRDARSHAIVTLMDRWGDAAIAIDDDVAERFPLHLPLTIVHNSAPLPAPGVDTREAKRRLGLPEDRVAIGFAGFVRRQKGWPELVEAARILVHEGIPAHFVIMGGGVRPPDWFRSARGRMLTAFGILADEESAIKALVAKYDLESHFSFLPFVTDTSEVYRALDVVTFPNQGVGLGRPVLEAAAQGKPVVASGSRAGAGVLLPDRTGLLLTDAGPRELADALRRLVGDPALRARLGDAAAAHAHDAFDPGRNARRVEAIYDELLAQAPPGRRRRLPTTPAGTTNGGPPSPR